ncbi:M20/M25/M40 family metallo-hydrolase [Myxococcota bacterium]|nr:M20/M25/M40 family metallo-hydrolase [Myxococcota bacterium]MBU1429583.1 M20/M25/M40 family metallo-hydrolase [Myxococcota bacterium]MBU1899476.1 M20/M25/M40 family metallo-hydrolase [Myxococcota bacterium]
MQDLLTEARAAAQRQATEILPVLERWVRQGSHSLDVAGVNAMGALLVEALDPLGLALHRAPGQGVGDHLFWTSPAWASAPPAARVVLLGHHDTVHATSDFDVWEIKGDRLRGPGVLDMKGGLAVAWAALKALASVGRLDALPLALISVGDEEISSIDSFERVQRFAAGAGAALIFEAGRAEDRIITRRKGTGRVEVIVEGRAAHSGNAHREGINAIWALSRYVDQAQRLTDYTQGVTVNVGLIEGGVGANTVAAAARCVHDFRYERAADGAALMADVTRLAATLEAETGARFILNGDVRRPPLEKTPASQRLFEAYAAAAAQAGLGCAEADLIGGGSDASTTSAVGVPSIDGLGPRGAHFHTHDEFIEISSLAPKVEALVIFLLSWAP